MTAYTLSVISHSNQAEKWLGNTWTLEQAPPLPPSPVTSSPTLQPQQASNQPFSNPRTSRYLSTYSQHTLTRSNKRKQAISLLLTHSSQPNTDQTAPRPPTPCPGPSNYHQAPQPLEAPPLTPLRIPRTNEPQRHWFRV